MKCNIRGVSYAYERTGRGIPLLLLHGFTGSKKTWEPFLAIWSQMYEVITVDLPGHGETDSPSDPKRYAMEEVAKDVSLLLDVLKIDRVHVLGYSMGGRVALAFACLHGNRVRTLMLENCTPGLEDEEARIARIEQDEELATYIETYGMAAFTTRWEQVSLFQTQQTLPSQTKQNIRAQRLQNSVQGLANSLRGMGTGRQPSFWGRLQSLTMPVLLLSGVHDEKFFHILSRMEKMLKKATLVQISDAGHAIHVEQREKFDTIVREFLQTNEEA